MSNRDRARIVLVQQGIWDAPLESMPLAAGYLASTALADSEIRDRVDIRIANFRGGVGVREMADQLFGDGVPDIIGFSVLGWNFRSFGVLAEAFRQLNPHGWVVFGGTHVAHQAERVFRMFPNVDVVVNGEGELTFRDLLRAYLDGRDVRDLTGIEDVSFSSSAGRVVTNPARDRIMDLDVIPSPVLSGAIDLTLPGGGFRYDVALMETNRGCPYKCAFCFWGGAVGQKVREFSRGRLRRELEVYGSLKVHTIVLCDANFGMLQSDRQFVEDLIEVREEFGYPLALETSWAKNKSRVFYDIVQRMKQAGLRSSFTLALQSLNDDALGTMRRRNMKVNEWEDLVSWLNDEGMDCYAELIWGAPGETPESFFEGYDRLAKHMSRIAVYPVLLLPNTDYSEKKAEYGISTVRGDHDDFEYVLSHDTMTFAQNQDMHRFLFWTRTIAENAILRHCLVAAMELAHIRQSEALRDLDDWMRHSTDPAAVPLQQAMSEYLGSYEAAGRALKYLRTQPDALVLLERWWSDLVDRHRHELSDDVVSVLLECFRYDMLTQPLLCRDAGVDGENLDVIERDGIAYYVRRDVPLRYDVPGIVRQLRGDITPDLGPSPAIVTLYYRIGFESFVSSTNHEETMHYLGVTASEAAKFAESFVDDESNTPLLAQLTGG